MEQSSEVSRRPPPDPRSVWHGKGPSPRVPRLPFSLPPGGLPRPCPLAATPPGTTGQPLRPRVKKQAWPELTFAEIGHGPGSAKAEGDLRPAGPCPPRWAVQTRPPTQGEKRASQRLKADGAAPRPVLSHPRLCLPLPQPCQCSLGLTPCLSLAARGARPTPFPAPLAGWDTEWSCVGLATSGKVPKFSPAQSTPLLIPLFVSCEPH